MTVHTPLLLVTAGKRKIPLVQESVLTDTSTRRHDNGGDSEPLLCPSGKETDRREGGAYIYHTISLSNVSNPCSRMTQMTIEQGRFLRLVYDVPHPDGSEGLLAMVIRKGYDAPPGAGFLTEPKHGLQVGTLNYKAGHVVKPHLHRPTEKIVRQTQEALFVRRGSIQVDVYTSSGVFLDSPILVEGDCVILLAGGHAVVVLEDSELLEIKLGPYQGREADKQDLFPTP